MIDDKIYEVGYDAGYIDGRSDGYELGYKDAVLDYEKRMATLMVDLKTMEARVAVLEKRI